MMLYIMGVDNFGSGKTENPENDVRTTAMVIKFAYRHEGCIYVDVVTIGCLKD